MDGKDRPMFKTGDNICYTRRKNGEQEPVKGMVLQVKNRIKISYFDATEQKVEWVDADDLKAQDDSRCAHNAECGWCDDTGKCIYDMELAR